MYHLIATTRIIAGDFFHNLIQSGTCTIDRLKFDFEMGSILGPRIFIIYINDIVKSSYLFQFIMFEDDTNLFASHSNLDELLKIVNQEIAKISDRLKIYKLSLKVEKPITLFFIIDKRKFLLGLKL